MQVRVATNTLNFLLSERMTYQGPDTMALIEIIRELQTEINNGSESNTQSGNKQTSAE